MKPSGDELKADGVETWDEDGLQGQESPIGAWADSGKGAVSIKVGGKRGQPWPSNIPQWIHTFA